jgi:hypothetical protein
VVVEHYVPIPEVVEDKTADPVAVAENPETVAVSTWAEAVDRPTRLMVLSRFLSLLARNALFVVAVAAVAQDRVSLVVAVD